MAGSYRAENRQQALHGSGLDRGTVARVAARLRPWLLPARRARTAAPATLEEVRVRVDSDRALVDARRQARRLASQAGLTTTDIAVVVTAVSELARNILLYAGSGDVLIAIVRSHTRAGVTVVASDRGPGIADTAQALEDGFSTAERLGLGLSGVKRLMDEFEISSAPGEGTTVLARKWRR